MVQSPWDLVTYQMVHQVIYFKKSIDKLRVDKTKLSIILGYFLYSASSSTRRGDIPWNVHYFGRRWQKQRHLTGASINRTLPHPITVFKGRQSFYPEFHCINHHTSRFIHQLWLDVKPVPIDFYFKMLFDKMTDV